MDETFFNFLVFFLTGIITFPFAMNGNNDTVLIPENEISTLDTKRIEAGKAASSSKKTRYSTSNS